MVVETPDDQTSSSPPSNHRRLRRRDRSRNRNSVATIAQSPQRRGNDSLNTAQNARAPRNSGESSCSDQLDDKPQRNRSRRHEANQPNLSPASSQRELDLGGEDDKDLLFQEDASGREDGGNTSADEGEVGLILTDDGEPDLLEGELPSVSPPPCLDRSSSATAAAVAAASYVLVPRGSLDEEDLLGAEDLAEMAAKGVPDERDGEEEEGEVEGAFGFARQPGGDEDDVMLVPTTTDSSLVSVRNCGRPQRGQNAACSGLVRHCNGAASSHLAFSFSHSPPPTGGGNSSHRMAAALSLHQASGSNGAGGGPLMPLAAPQARGNAVGPRVGGAQPVQNAVGVARGAAAAALGVALGPHLPPHAYNPMHNWQASKTSLKERFTFMFCNEILADVHFVVGRGHYRQRIPAHKFVLSVGSAVFDAMFNGAMALSQADPEIDLPDVEPAAFLALLKFLYSDDVQIGPESVMTTLYTAKKYAVPALENACVDFLKRNLSPDNAFMLLTQARLFDEPQLAALCLESIDKHTAEALHAEGFTDIDLETLCAVLERDSLRIREVTLYQAVARWSTSECHRQQLPVTPDNQRQVLGRALQYIRFPLMTVEEFAQSAAQSGILTDREVVNLFLYFTVNPKPSVGFLDVPRCSVTGKEQVVNRFQRIEGRWGYSGTPDRIKFTVDRRIFVVGFGLYGSIHGPTEYQVNIQLIHCSSGKVVGSNDTTFQCDGSTSTFRVLFKEPVEIPPCVTYIASATLKGPDSHYGTKGLRRMVHQSSSNGMVTFQFTYAAGNNNGTSVEDGQIPEIIFYTKLNSA